MPNGSWSSPSSAPTGGMSGRILRSLCVSPNCSTSALTSKSKPIRKRATTAAGACHRLEDDGMHLGAIPLLAEFEAERLEHWQDRRNLFRGWGILVHRRGQDIPELQRVLQIQVTDWELRVDELRCGVVVSGRGQRRFARVLGQALQPDAGQDFSRRSQLSRIRDVHARLDQDPGRRKSPILSKLTGARPELSCAFSTFHARRHIAPARRSSSRQGAP